MPRVVSVAFLRSPRPIADRKRVILKKLGEGCEVEVEAVGESVTPSSFALVLAGAFGTEYVEADDESVRGVEST